MFSENPQDKVVVNQSGPKKAADPFNVDHLNDQELADLRGKIDARLGGHSLKDLDMEKELLQQYNLTKRFLSDVIGDESIPANQKAQVINSCTSILKELTATQTDLYNAERLKKMESALIQCLKELPKEAQQVFMQQYEDCLTAALLNPEQ